MGLRVTEVNASDEIKIRTQFSDYSFQVTDPGQCKGVLSGGPLGDRQHDALFAGAIPPASSQASDASRLEAGYRAVFLLAGPGIYRLTTSIITEITLFETPVEDC